MPWFPTRTRRKRGAACEYDWDGDGLIDSEDVCLGNPRVNTSDFNSRDYHTMDLCERSNVTRQSLSNSCKKPPPAWEFRGENEIYQGRNSRVTIGVSSQLFGSVDFNGTLYVEDKTDNDWIGIVWGMLTINEFYMLISNRQSDNKKKNEIA